MLNALFWKQKFRIPGKANFVRIQLQSDLKQIPWSCYSQGFQSCDILYHNAYHYLLFFHKNKREKRFSISDFSVGPDSLKERQTRLRNLTAIQCRSNGSRDYLYTYLNFSSINKTQESNISVKT